MKRFLLMITPFIKVRTTLVSPKPGEGGSTPRRAEASARRRINPQPPSRLFSAGLVLAMALITAQGQVVTQTITLRPGWNAVYLLVQPEHNSADAVFSRQPIASVWARGEKLSSADYIQNASEAAFNNAGWLAWFHPSRPEAFLNNLFAVFPNRAYLIKCTNSAPVLWSITGRPSLQPLSWVPDAYNLRGLPVDATNPPTFLDFLRFSKAHFDSSSGQLERIYQLNGSGEWTPVSPADAIQQGEAYWIYTRGPSDYVAPLAASPELGDGLDFGTDLTDLNLQLANNTASPRTALIRELGVTGTAALSYYHFETNSGGIWTALSGVLMESPAPGSATRLRLAIRRQDFGTNDYTSIVEIRDGAGTRLLVPVLATGGAADAPNNPIAKAMSHVGLWVGTASINAVSEAHSANPTTPTPTKSEMNLRLLLHVDATGKTRFLKEVTQMWRNGTYTNDANGNRVVDKPGQYVLITDDALISRFSGATLRDGEPVGRRLSTVGYDFPSTGGTNFLPVNGAFAAGQTLTATFTLPFDDPNNPFKHKYHPDHDNLNSRFDGPEVESYTVTRQIEWQLAASPPPGPSVPDYGFNEFGGHYAETITGLHKNPIYLSGTFRLRRASYIGQLNPSPTP